MSSGDGETAGVGVVLGEDAMGVVIRDVLVSGGASMVEHFSSRLPQYLSRRMHH